MTLRARGRGGAPRAGGHGRLVRLHLRTPNATTTLALVPLGYADGIPRQASGGGARC